MAPPTLYYMLLSPPVRSVLLTAKALGLELNLKEINLLCGEHMSEDFIRMNPQHTVPTLVDGDFVLWDSHAIVTYLISKYGKDDKLYPKDLQKRARIDQRLHYDSGVLFPTGHHNVHNVVKGGATEIADSDKQKMNDIFKMLETFLENDLYLVGDTLTVADLSCISMITLMEVMCPLEHKYPKLSEYIERMSKLPYYDEITVKGNKILMDIVKTKMEENKAKAK